MEKLKQELSEVVVDGEEKDYDIKSDATVELNGDVVASIAKPTGGLFNVFGTFLPDDIELILI